MRADDFPPFVFDFPSTYAALTPSLPYPCFYAQTHLFIHALQSIKNWPQLYNYTVAYDVYESYIPTFAGRYLSSNINITLPVVTSIVGNNINAASPSSITEEEAQQKKEEKEVPFGSRYLKFRTPNQNLSITAFGILFGFDRADKGLKVQSVLEMLQERWWKDGMESSSDTDVFIIREFVCPSQSVRKRSENPLPKEDC